jgi:hypothetical protein
MKLAENENIKTVQPILVVISTLIEENPAAVSLDRKYDCQPATGHCFFCLKQGSAITMDSDSVMAHLCY